MILKIIIIHLILVNVVYLFKVLQSNSIYGFKKLFISQEYLKRNPSLLLAPEISIPLKYVICRILGIESYFVDVCEMNTNLFLARFLYMQRYEQFEHKDLLLSEAEFENKYNVSSRILTLNYKIDYQTVENISIYYVSLSEKMPNWHDIVFPNFEQILKYVNSQALENNNLKYDYCKYRELYNISKSKYELFINLKALHLDENECLFMLNKHPNLVTSDKDNLLKIVEILKKYGLNLEQIVVLLFNSPSIFANSIRDFASIVEEIMERENCLPAQAVYLMA